MTYTPPANTKAVTIPTYTGGNSAGTLSYYAQQAGTTPEALLSLNAGNPSVKSLNTILSGGTLYLPGETTPAGPTGLPSGGTPTPKATTNPGLIGKTSRMDYSDPNNPNGTQINVDPATGLDIPGQGITTGTPPPSGPNNTGNTNPTITSDGYRAATDAMGAEITTYMQQLQDRRDKQVADIKAQYDSAKALQDERLAKEYAGRSTGLVTAGGGFLGGTQSHEGILQNLSQQQETERQALMSKRDTALQEAENAFNDKEFELAGKKLSLARDTEQELYNRSKDAADMQLRLSKENRDAQEFKRSMAQDDLKMYSELSDADFKSTDPAKIKAIDDLYYAGFTNDMRTIAQKEKTKADQKDQTDQDIKILDVLSKIPQGQTVTLGGKTYVGKKAPASVSMKGVITPQRANIAGLPQSIVGMNENDLILSLELAKPAQWFVDTVNANPPTNKQLIGPTGQYQEEPIPITPEYIQTHWDAFRNSEDVQSYRNTVKLDNRHSVDSGNGLTAEDIAAAVGGQ